MAKFNILQFIGEQWATLPGYSGDLNSRVVMVVGCNVGIGLEASVHFMRLDPKLLLATCRDEEKCKRTQEIILERASPQKQRTGDKCDIASWLLALDTFDNVSAFANRFAVEAPEDGRLSALVVSAGVYGPKYTRTVDGWEMTLQVNYLSMALLSILMLPYLVKSSSPDFPSRLVVVSSIGHHLGAQSLKGAEKWTSVLQSMNARVFCTDQQRYFVTKLLEVMFIRELAAHLPEPTPVVACTVNPGFCRSSLFRVLEGKWYLRPFKPLLNVLLCARSCEEGSRTLVHAVMAGQNPEIHGRYLSVGKVMEENDFLFTSEGKAFSRRLWTETLDVLSKVDNRVLEISKQYLRLS